MHYCKIFVIGTCLVSLSILVYVEHTTEHYGFFERCMIAGEVLFSDEEILIQHQKNTRITQLIKSKEKRLRQLETEMKRKLDQKAFLQTLEQNLQNIAQQLDDK